MSLEQLCQTIIRIEVETMRARDFSEKTPSFSLCNMKDPPQMPNLKTILSTTSNLGVVLFASQ